LITLWILVILTLFAIGVGYRASLELRLSRYNIDNLKTSLIAKAGIQTALVELEKDTQDSDSKNYDTLYKCGITLEEEQTPEILFKDILVGNGYFTIKYQSSEDTQEDSEEFYGMLDEERKININTINIQNYAILVNLFERLDIEVDEDVIVASIVDWHDSNLTVTDAPNGAEDAYYMDLEQPYHCKNAPFQNLEELLLVRGMTQEIFDKIKDFVTVYPIEASSLKVNVNTASEVTLMALSEFAVEHVPETSQMDAHTLVEKIINYRAGDDNIEATEDDRLVEIQGLRLNTNENNLFIYLTNNFFANKSDYFRVKSQGVYSDGKIITNIEAVLDRNQLSAVYWHES